MPSCAGGCRLRTLLPLSGWSETSGARLRKNSSKEELNLNAIFLFVYLPLNENPSPSSFPELTCRSLCDTCVSRWRMARRRSQMACRGRGCAGSRSSPGLASCLSSRRRSYQSYPTACVKTNMSNRGAAIAEIG